MPSFTTKPEFIVVLLAATPILAPPCGSHLAGIGIIKHCIQATESLQFQREHKEASGARKKNKTKSFAPIPSVVHSNDFSRALTRLEKKKKKKKNQHLLRIRQPTTVAFTEKEYFLDSGWHGDGRIHGPLRKG